MAARVALDSEELLEKNNAWNSAAKPYIRSNGESIHLSPLIEPHLQAMVQHIGWIFPTLIKGNLKVIEECDELISKRNMLPTVV